ncbi:hypothetical protein [Dyella sp. A6]|uniref:hypothetical protein n=1 Tax=Dyella aluminiiresistens TaxID=3069105 RepID=UPI002E77816B|nr:hypothetical protein [Dyella sp. A6]
MGDKDNKLDRDGIQDDGVSYYPANTSRWRPWAFAIMTLMLITGSKAMSSQDNSDFRQPPALTREVPLHFGGHNFAAHCYNAIGCKVIYYRREVDNAPDQVSPPPPANLKDAWGGYDIALPSFPCPVEVHWKSLDGVQHDAKVDLDAIFKDRLIWHNVPKADMTDFYEGRFAGFPNIDVEVNDRTISVYISMLIPTKMEQIPGNKDSDFRDDMFLAWRHTY